MRDHPTVEKNGHKRKLCNSKPLCLCPCEQCAVARPYEVAHMLDTAYAEAGWKSVNLPGDFTWMVVQAFEQAGK